MGPEQKGINRVSQEIILQAGPHSLGIRPDLGGCVSFLRTGEVNWLRPLGGDDHRKCASYPLVPFSNRIQDARFTFDGREILLNRNFQPEPHAIHGHGWQNPWMVLAQSETEVTLSYRHVANDWPWDYEARQTIRLTEEGAVFSMGLTNLSARSMPGGLGFHPFFLKKGDVELQMHLENFHLSEGCIPQGRDNQHPILGALTASSPVPEGFDDGFDGWDGRAVISWPEEGRKLTMTASDNARNVIFYSPEGREYFCVEPVTHMTDAVHHLDDPDWPDHGLQILESGKTMEMEMTFSLDWQGK